MKLKNVFAAIGLIAILVCGIYAAGAMYQSGPTYDGSKTDVVALEEKQTELIEARGNQNPFEEKDVNINMEDKEVKASVDVSNPDGVADAIVKKNLFTTVSHNVVASVVFNFRGYDTMGESFILVTAVTGTLVILRKAKKEK